MSGLRRRFFSSWPRAGLALGLAAVGLSFTVVAGAPPEDGRGRARGSDLYRRHCAVCHGLDGRGDGPNAPFVGDDRPRDLTDARYMGRRSDEQLERAIAGGGEAFQGSRFMPAWGRTLSPSQVRDVAAYVRTLSASGPTMARPGGPDGDRLAAELGCPACHRMRSAVSTRVGPDLTAQGSRVQRAWLGEFLRSPRTIRPAGYQPLTRSRMPDFRLRDDEAAALADYLSSRRAARLESPPEPAVASDLEARGREAFMKYACRACHRLDGEGGVAGPDLSAVAARLRPGWVRRYLQDPQAVDPLSPMPRVGLSDEEASAVTRFLFGGSRIAADAPPAADAMARGQRLFRALACARCHGELPDTGDHPGPDLRAAGEKLRPEWIADFLARPSTVRPWITARMPNFRLTADETAEVVGFLARSRDAAVPRLPEHLRFTGSVTASNVAAGRRLASRAFLSCSSCHVGEERPSGAPEEWAPDLRLSARRLDPDWIVRWLLDPARLVPGTKMPAFFADAAAGPEDILDGDEQRQAVALRDYILHLDSNAPAAVSAPPAPGRWGP